ncbi:MAG: hypothetical protein RBS72_20205 [Sedimentisphaerales bacterium]|jgi:hypothetical protein|nr:hypothetical protein [Sedimentisphaerales bacterium]HNY78274.1 hypothetical protein [Sedimentisphaerales bacterium]HOC61821.1 hypothetical protein [Sedimentisphaerales bacterium]HOH64325.1 hypothetical protein [Sedimentisphaerales bacterium]HPY50253.1 hypothetical protein [Sedimentisphaerales bacterium]
MRHAIGLAAILVALFSSNVCAGGDLGVGVIVGEPTGLSVKCWLDGERAIDGAAGWSFSGKDSFHLHADYLVHRFDLFQNPEDAQGLAGTAFYYGVGARLKDKDRDGDTAFGIRIPLGITHLFAETPFDLFAEIVPLVDLTPDVDLDLNVAVGLRFYFK